MEPKPIGEGYAKHTEPICTEIEKAVGKKIAEIYGRMERGRLKRRYRYVQRGQNTVFDAIVHPKKRGERVVVAEKFFSGGEGDCVFLVFSDQDAKRMGEDGLFSAIDRESPRLIKNFSH